MTRAARQRIFYVLLTLFFISGIMIVLYAEGWRIDITLWPWRPEKVGAIYVRSYPLDASLKLNNKFIQNDSGILSQGTLISDLYPRTYSLDLAASGYDAWHENVSVLPSLVTTLKYAVLVPQTATTTATTTASNFTLVDGEPIVQTPAGAEVWHGKTIGYGTIIAESGDLTEAVMKDEANGAYALYHFAGGNNIDLSTELAANGVNTNTIVNIEINPNDASEIMVETTGRVLLFHTAAGTITVAGAATPRAALAGPIAASAPADAWSIFIRAAGAGTNRAGGITAIAFYDRYSSATSTSSSTILGRTVQLSWIRPGLLGVLQSDGSLYLYDTAGDTFQKLADSVKQFASTSDGSLIAALEQESFEVFSFTNIQSYHRFNLPDVAGVSHIFWYGDRDHLFVVYPGHISFLDLNDLALSNFTTVANIAAGTAPAYDANSNALYFIDPSHKLARMDFPG